VEVKDWSRGERGGVYFLHFITKAHKLLGLGAETKKHTFIPAFVTSNGGKAPTRYSVKLGMDTIPKEGNVNYSAFTIFTTSRGRSKIPTFRAAGFVEPKHIPSVVKQCQALGHLVEVIND
jgi:hypothetical protein